jgi:chemotaxis response regulator CheB
MARSTQKKIIKNVAVEKTISTALSSLTSIKDDCAAAVVSRSNDAKKWLAESKKLTKKRATLMKRKKAAATRLKKNPNADNRKAVKAVEKELATIVKMIDKSKPQKQANADELAGLKANLKAVSAYLISIEKSRKALEKPKKSKKKPKRKAVATSTDMTIVPITNAA